MMRSMLRTGGGLLLFAMLVLVGKTLSNPNPPADPKVPPPKNRIALINLTLVFKGYVKVAGIDKKTHDLATRLKTNDPRVLSQQNKMLQDHYDSLDREWKKWENMKHPEEIRVRTALEGELTKLKLEIDNVKSAVTLLRINKEEQAGVIYKKISEAARCYAKEHDLDVVFQYNDIRVGWPEYFGTANDHRTIHDAGVVPIYIRVGVDITNEIIHMLTDAYLAEPKPGAKDKP
jgi:Skp family chaperone for outer membrane proteins